MKTNFFLGLLISLLFVNTSSAQFNVPNGYFNETSTVTCPFDSSQSILQADNWLIYQTLDNLWNGSIDSSKCISLVEDGFSYRVNLDQIDPGKPFFIRSLMDENTKVLLDPNWLYHVQGIAHLSVDIPLNLSSDCENGVCSGVILGVEVPNEDSTGTNVRFHTSNFSDLVTCDASLCLPTESFENNYLSEFIFKFTFDSLDLMNVFIKPTAVYIEFPWEISYTDQTVFANESHYNPSDSTYQLQHYDIMTSGWGYSTLVIYTDSTYPSAQNVSYIDLTVEPEQTEAQNIHLQIDEYESLHFQPFTGLQGGLIAGSDSLRHHLSVTNEGTMCFIDFIELTFGSNERFISQGGNVNFQGNFSCMQFMEGGKLIVADNSTFHYGNNGMGMLALRQGGSIELGKNSTLIIDNTLAMHEVRTDTPQQIYMTLDPESSLIFGEHAHLTNKYSIDQKMKLNIYMNGGVLDDRHLSVKERALINKIYPSGQENTEFASSISPNPATSYALWSYHSTASSEVSFSIYDLSGRLVEKQKHQLQIGPNEIPIDLRAYTNGVYLLHWNTGEESGVKKWVKQ